MKWQVQVLVIFRKPHDRQFTNLTGGSIRKRERQGSTDSLSRGALRAPVQLWTFTCQLSIRLLKLHSSGRPSATSTQALSKTVWHPPHLLITLKELLRGSQVEPQDHRSIRPIRSGVISIGTPIRKHCVSWVRRSVVPSDSLQVPGIREHKSCLASYGPQLFPDMVDA
jgi:hypothetical protein